MKKGLVLLGLWCAASSFAGVLVDFDLGMIFPKNLSGLEFDRAVKYDEESFGYSVAYKRGEGFAASVTVCNMGLNDIPDGYKGEGIDFIFKSVETAREFRVQELEISKPRKRGSTVVPKKGAIRFSNTVFQHSEFREVEGRARNVSQIQSVYITAIQGRFVKLDFTFDAIESAPARLVSEQMVAQLIGMLQSRPSEQDLLVAACDALLLDPAGYGGRTAAQQVIAKARTMGDLVIYPELFAWPTSYFRRPKNSELLTAAYLAGMLQVILPQQLGSGGEFEGFAAMLHAYKTMRAKEEIQAIETFEEWAAAPDFKVLFDQLMVEFNYRLPEQK